VTVGGLPREELSARLESKGVLLNPYAETLLADPAFDDVDNREGVSIVERSLINLGLVDGAALSRIYAQTEPQGLRLCPGHGPYLRLALTEQAEAPDSVLSSGRAPSGSLTVAAHTYRMNSVSKTIPLSHRDSRRFDIHGNPRAQPCPEGP
jgi:hypothetical protein